MTSHEAGDTQTQPRTRAESALERLVTPGGRRTGARAGILEVMTGTDEHLSVQEIYERVSQHQSLSISTVHRNLERLCASGLAHALPFPGEARYALTDQTHGHANCSSCGATQDIPVDAMAAIVRLVERETKFAVAPSGVGIQGLCPNCQEPEATPDS